MIVRIIEYSVRNRYLVILVWLGIAVWGLYAVLHTPVDAIPDLSENQVIVFADWMGRSPQDIEEQITYPLSVQLQGLAGVKAVRSSSEPNFSMINIIFDDKTDFYFARTRVLEKLTTAAASLPAGVTPVMAPDATALGQIFWYTVEGEGKSLDELRAIQDFTVRYQLNSVPGVAEVASVGGFVREYQVDINPAKLRAYDLPLSAATAAIAASNMSVGGKVIVTNGTEYLVRGIGWLTGVKDLENVVIASRQGVPIRIQDVATVQLGPEFRRSALEKNGQEAVGGVVMMRVGQNPLEVTYAIKEKIRDMQSGLPDGVRIIPFYDRTRLIESAIHTVTATLREEIIIASIAILLILTHFRSAFVVCVTLPLAVLISFLFMYYLGIPSNIMSLSGIAISIGILVDAAVVMVENASHELKAKFGDEIVRGDTTEIVIKSCRLVGRPIFFSVLIMLVSFLPVFSFGGQEGKLSHPLAFTKSFAMIGVAILAITLVPALIPLFIKGRIRGEEENWIVRSFIHIYRPVLSWVIDRPGVVWWIMAVIISLGAALVGSVKVSAIALGLGLLFVLLGVSRTLWRAIAVASLLAIAFLADTRFPKLGSEFMPKLNEGSIMDMPVTAPRVAMSEAVDDVIVRDRLLRSFPEVEQAVGKVGRATTATDPSPIDMVETIASLRPGEWWPKRKLRFDDALAQAAVVAVEMQRQGWLKGHIGSASPAADPLLNTAAQISVESFDRAMRDLARRRQIEFEPQLADSLTRLAYDELLAHIRRRALLREPTDAERDELLQAAHKHGLLLAQNPRQEEADKLLGLLRTQLINRGIAADRDDLLLDTPNLPTQALHFLERAVGRQPANFAERILAKLESRRDELWRERIKTLNWELFDHGKLIINDLLLDALHRTALGTPQAGLEPPVAAIADASRALAESLGQRLFLWQKTKDDLVTEMDSELQMPGWGNVWTQPIINRVNMLATGVRTQIGVKVFGPAGKPIGGDSGAIADIQRVSQRIADRLRTVRGAVDVVADQSVGKRYLEIQIDRQAATRYGVNMSDISEAIETAMGGSKAAMTVEGRQRFPVRVRYAQDYWQDIESIKDVLVTGRTTPAQLLETAPTRSASGMIQIPLRMVADIRVVEGPSMIKSENGRLRNYVMLNVRDRDIVGFVEEAKQAVKGIEQELAGTGMSIEWSGEFEAQLRARQTLTIIFPMVILLILFLLYVTFKDLADTMLVFLGVIGALAGALMFQSLFGFNFSVIVSIGYVAAFGMATQTGVIMLVYLREAIDRRGGLQNIPSLSELRQAVIQGAVHRLRPKLLTEGVAIVGLVPMLWAAGTGSEIMRPMAAPVLGGLLISDEVIDLMIPVLFYWIRRRRMMRQKKLDNA
jgi:Cu(I)/Ag(I) efflux system membrane protein CusA/SilA